MTCCMSGGRLPDGKVPMLGASPSTSQTLATESLCCLVQVCQADGEVIITNDGATILNKMIVTQPAAKMLVELAKSQVSRVPLLSWNTALLARPSNSAWMGSANKILMGIG